MCQLKVFAWQSEYAKLRLIIYHVYLSTFLKPGEETEKFCDNVGQILFQENIGWIFFIIKEFDGKIGKQNVEESCMEKFEEREGYEVCSVDKFLEGIIWDTQKNHECIIC